MNNHRKIQIYVDISILVAIILFMSCFLNIRLVFLDTIVTGGDSASWYQVAVHLKETLIPNARLFGWDMANFGGYPNFNFYFIPPFLIAVLLSYTGMPLTICLKLVIVSGWYILPFSVYFGLRLMKFRFPSPVVGAAASLLFLFNESYTMFGGNILSTLAGEFCYMFAFSLLPFFMGSMVNGFDTNKHIKRNGVLLGVIGLSHLFVFIPAVSVVLAGFFSKKRIVYVLQVCAIGFGVMAFWILPLIAWRHLYTIPVYMIWQEYANWYITLRVAAFLAIVFVPLIVFQKVKISTHKQLRITEKCKKHLQSSQWLCRIQISQLVFGFLCIVLLIAMIGWELLQTIRPEPTRGNWILLALWTLWLSCIVFVTPMGRKACRLFLEIQPDIVVFIWISGICIVMYYCAHFLQVPDIRFVPPVLLIVILIVFSFYVGQYLAVLPGSIQYLSILFIVIGIGLVVIINEKNAQEWFDYNFKGYEQTRGFSDFKACTDYLATNYNDPINAPRVGYEKCNRYGPYGGDRVFESLYLFSGRQTLEGIHYSSSLSSKFITFLQTEFSKDLKTPTPFILSKINPQTLANHMSMYNMSQLILLSPLTRQAFSESPLFVHEINIGPFSIFSLKQGASGYVSTLDAPPILYTGKNWLADFYDQWFKSNEKPDAYYVPDRYVIHPEDRAVFRAQADHFTMPASGYQKSSHKNLGIVTCLEHLKITFNTTAIGVPHIIRVSYFPNWQVTGAYGVYPITPHFMMVIPRSSTVTLTYGRCKWEVFGWGITLITWILLFAAIISNANTVWKNDLYQLCLFARYPLEKSLSVLWILMIIAAIVLSISGAMNRNLPVRTYLKGNALFQKGIQLKKQMALKKADLTFEKGIHILSDFLNRSPHIDHQDIIHCRILLAKNHKQLKQYSKAHAQYDRIIHDFPYSRYIAESHVRKSRLFRINRDLNFKAGIRGQVKYLDRSLEQTQQSIDQLNLALKADPYSHWADVARKELHDEKEVLQNMMLKVPQNH